MTKTCEPCAVGGNRHGGCDGGGCACVERQCAIERGDRGPLEPVSWLAWEDDGEDPTPIESAYILGGDGQDPEDIAQEVAVEALEFWASTGRFAGDPMPETFEIFVRDSEKPEAVYRVTLGVEWSPSFHATKVEKT